MKLSDRQQQRTVICWTLRWLRRSITAMRSWEISSKASLRSSCAAKMDLRTPCGLSRVSRVSRGVPPFGVQKCNDGRVPYALDLCAAFNQVYCFCALCVRCESCVLSCPARLPAVCVARGSPGIVSEAREGTDGTELVQDFRMSFLG